MMKTKNIIYFIFRYKQFVWMVHVSKLPVSGFNWVKNVSKIDEDFIKNYDEDSDKGYILEANVEYPENLHDLHSELPFLPATMKIDKCS